MVKKSLAAVLAASALFSAGAGAQAQNRYMGEIILVGYNFCPRGTEPAEGQLLPISSNAAMFSLFGTMYGGDGSTTFALPDLRGRSPIGVGQGPGLSTFSQGQKAGSERQTHGADGGPVSMTEVGVFDPRAISSTARDIQTVEVPTTSSGSGGGTSGTRPPELALRYCVVMQRVYPSRN